MLFNNRNPGSETQASWIVGERREKKNYVGSETTPYIC